MSYEYKDGIIEDVKAHCKTKNKNIAVYPVYHYEDKVEEIHHVYSQATKADEYEANLKEVKEQLKIKIRHSREDGDYSEAYGFSKSLDMIENLI